MFFRLSSLLLVALCGILAQAKVQYHGTKVLKVHVPDQDKAAVINELEEHGDLSLWGGGNDTVDVMVPSDTLSNVTRGFAKYNIQFEEMIPDLQEAIDRENPAALMIEDYEIPAKGHRMEWKSYHALEDVLDYVDYLAATFPDVCSVATIGYSVEKRPLKVLRISNGKAGVPAIWIDGGIHAREWISVASVTYIIEQIIANRDKLEVDYYILPVHNPDGYVYTHKEDRMWRKNRNKVTAFCAGIDLNRNYGYKWGGAGTSNNACRDIYRGTGPFSEPETAAVKNFFQTSAANWKAFLTFHSYGQYILYPWGYDAKLPSDYRDLDNLGKLAAAAMKQADSAHTVYTVGNSAGLLYPAAGGSDDWAKAIMKIKYAYTVELRDTGRYGFVLPAQYIIPTAKEALSLVNVVTKQVLQDNY